MVQVARVIHIRSEVAVDAFAWNCPPLHAVTLRQIRSENAVSGLDSNCDDVQFVAHAHTRSVVTVLRAATYCVALLQREMCRQTRLEVTVACWKIYWDRVHTDSTLHTASVVGVGGLTR